MKNVTVILLTALNAGFIQAAALFTQDFSTSTNVSDYVNAAAPAQNQFTALATGGKGTFSIDAGKLSFVKTLDGNSSINRNTAMAGSPVGAVSFSYDLEMSFTSAANTSLISATIGSAGTNWMAYGIVSTGVANTWKMSGTANEFTGAQTLMFVLNDSGMPVTYTAPGGARESVAAGAFDLWVGSTKVYDDRTSTVNTAADISVFAINMQNAGSAATYRFDNFKVQPVVQTKLSLCVFTRS
jgi:hypothetical protein